MMNIKPDSYFKELLELTRQKYILLEDMLALTIEQSGAVSPEAADRLEELISIKQKIIDKIDKIDDDFGACFLKLKRELGVPDLSEIGNGGLGNASLGGVKELQDSISQVMALVEKINAIDSENKNNAQKALNDLESGFAGLNKAKRAASAYKTISSQNTSFFIDKKK